MGVEYRGGSIARLGLFLGLLLPTADAAAGVCQPCDVNCDTAADLLDIAPFVERLTFGDAGCSPCAGDLDGSLAVNGDDISLFIDCILNPPTGGCCESAVACSTTTESACSGLWMGPGGECEPNPCAFASLTAFRPQHGAAYFPHTKSAVAEVDEENAASGPGIRINGFGDVDPAGEDDLIEVRVDRTRTDIDLALRRGDDALRAWTTRDRAPGTEISFTADRTDALPFSAGGTMLTVWMEWAEAVHGDAELRLEPLDAEYALDVLRFHTFRSIVMALGGEDQTPSVPVNGGHGTFVVGQALYRRGYDVHLHDEDDVAANGSGAALTKVVDAVSHRLVDEVAIFGYSHGGGSTHDLAERLDNDRAGIGVFEILVTSYVDSIENDSDIDIAQELRRPPSSDFHANHYQVGTPADFFLDGGPVLGSEPAPTGTNIDAMAEVTTHFLVDDRVAVRTFIENSIVSRVAP